jgi:hypothetical protein
MCIGVLVKYLALILTVLLLGCGESSEPASTPQNYFNNNKAGSSSDYGVFYDGNVDDHIITVHGFLDDYKVCRDIVNMLTEQGKGKSYSCRKLN